MRALRRLPDRQREVLVLRFYLDEPEAEISRTGPPAPAASVSDSAMDKPRGPVIGLLHPGEMGAAVGRCLTGAGCEVLWASESRGPQTAARARAAGLTDAGTPAEVADRADVIFSICPPHAALDVAWAVQGFGGLFVDANAISPATAREVSLMVEEGGATYIDGGIIGMPPAPSPVTDGGTRLYLSGDEARAVRGLFDGTPVDARVLGSGLWAASTIKMAYAAWTKGAAALLLAARALARADGVEDALLAEWAMSQPSLADRSKGAASSAATKGWRWVAEMEEIAASMAAAGLPDGFHQAAAEIFRRSPRSEPAAVDGQVVDRVLAAITGDGPHG
jgi:3-hydroxyisobutyrate dehydrogenase-like beta-hydroxyacid dehydrogenase